MMMKKTAKYNLLIPEKVIKFLQQMPQDLSPFKGFNKDYLNQILSIICERTKKDNDGQLFTSLNIQILRKFVPSAEKYLKHLIELGIIERFGRYEKGKHSYKYRYKPEFLSKWLRIELINPKLERRIRNVQKSLKSRNSKKYPIQNRYLRSMTIEFEKALKFIEEHYTKSEIKKYNYAKSRIVKINNGDIYIKVNNTNFRLDSNLTNLPKVLRQFIRIYGKPIAGVDVKNSQPYLSTLVLTEPEKIERFYPYPDKFPSMMLKSMHLSEKEDVIAYVSLVVYGNFYEYLWKEFEKRGLHYADRDKIKKAVLIILFDKNYHYSKAKRIFAELFPNVEKAFALLRSTNYRWFSILLQRIESYLILDVIQDKLNKEYPELVTVTIHDSIYTTANKTDNEMHIIHKVMLDELEKFVGYPPRLTAEAKFPQKIKIFSYWQKRLLAAGLRD